MKKINLFALPQSLDLSEEVFQPLVENDHVLIERIISKAHVTPEGEWYDQVKNEWVMVLKGEAELTFIDGDKMRLKVGEAVELPAHCKHRVSWTSTDEETLWLAVHY
ncbi:cupin domain-containing protein [Shewanella surugensis]|uniref:Cupin domain-containing protein n=1 Tax=Shewanella surugensis TaxID=212020 RepID=A0ABT0LEA6_9GAMM|nr:cupin domain-containing protein [Shewanella surugensis]MCL1126023.1 cupin domain-containing protein [Shewanella surugensis]